MGMWPENIRRYQTRLEAFGWLCVNFHSYMNVKTDGEYVVPFRSPSWGGLPVEVREEMSLKDLDAMKNALIDLREEAERSGTHYSIDMDDILEALGWAFNPADIEGLKVVYTGPKDPKWAPKKRKKHEQS